MPVKTPLRSESTNEMELEGMDITALAPRSTYNTPMLAFPELPGRPSSPTLPYSKSNKPSLTFNGAINAVSPHPTLSSATSPQSSSGNLVHPAEAISSMNGYFSSSPISPAGFGTHRRPSQGVPKTPGSSTSYYPPILCHRSPVPNVRMGSSTTMGRGNGSRGASSPPSEQHPSVSRRKSRSSIFVTSPKQTGTPITGMYPRRRKESRPAEFLWGAETEPTTDIRIGQTVITQREVVGNENRQWQPATVIAEKKEERRYLLEFEDHATQWLLRDELRFLSSKENLNPLRSWDPRSTAEFKIGDLVIGQFFQRWSDGSLIPKWERCQVTQMEERPVQLHPSLYYFNKDKIPRASEIFYEIENDKGFKAWVHPERGEIVHLRERRALGV